MSQLVGREVLQWLSGVVGASVGLDRRLRGARGILGRRRLCHRRRGCVRRSAGRRRGRVGDGLAHTDTGRLRRRCGRVCRRRSELVELVQRQRLGAPVVAARGLRRSRGRGGCRHGGVLRSRARVLGLSLRRGRVGFRGTVRRDGRRVVRRADRRHRGSGGRPSRDTGRNRSTGRAVVGGVSGLFGRAGGGVSRRVVRARRCAVSRRRVRRRGGCCFGSGLLAVSFGSSRGARGRVSSGGRGRRCSLLVRRCGRCRGERVELVERQRIRSPVIATRRRRCGCRGRGRLARCRVLGRRGGLGLGRIACRGSCLRLRSGGGSGVVESRGSSVPVVATGGGGCGLRCLGGFGCLLRLRGRGRVVECGRRGVPVVAAGGGGCGLRCLCGFGGLLRLGGRSRVVECGRRGVPVVTTGRGRRSGGRGGVVQSGGGGVPVVAAGRGGRSLSRRGRGSGRVESRSGGIPVVATRCGGRGGRLRSRSRGGIPVVGRCRRSATGRRRSTGRGSLLAVGRRVLRRGSLRLRGRVLGGRLLLGRLVLRCAGLHLVGRLCGTLRRLLLEFGGGRGLRVRRLDALVDGVVTADLVLAVHSVDADRTRALRRALLRVAHEQVGDQSQQQDDVFEDEPLHGRVPSVVRAHISVATLPPSHLRRAGIYRVVMRPRALLPWWGEHA